MVPDRKSPSTIFFFRSCLNAKLIKRAGFYFYAEMLVCCHENESCINDKDIAVFWVLTVVMSHNNCVHTRDAFSCHTEPVLFVSSERRDFSWKKVVLTYFVLSHVYFCTRHLKLISKFCHWKEEQTLDYWKAQYICLLLVSLLNEGPKPGKE